MSAALRGPVVGLVLAGGRASRMGGRDKALLPVGGRPILHHVLDRLRPCCATVVLSANGDPARFSASGMPVVPDDVPGFAGPLAGLLVGMDWAARTHPDATDVLSVPADTPFLPADLLPRLQVTRRDAGAPLACARSGGRTHPTVGLWPVEVRHALRTMLVANGERRIGRAAAGLGVAAADWGVEPVDPFLNVNTPDDLAAAERVWAEVLAPRRNPPTASC